MRSLFFKLFIWFWLANILVAGAGILAILATAPKPDPAAQQWRFVARSMLSDFGQEALIVLNDGGAPSLEKFRINWQMRTGSRIGLYDIEGRDMSRPRRDELAAELFALLDGDDDVAVIRRGPITFVATTVLDSTGIPYVVVREVDARPMISGGMRGPGSGVGGGGLRNRRSDAPNELRRPGLDRGDRGGRRRLDGGGRGLAGDRPLTREPATTEFPEIDLTGTPFQSSGDEAPPATLLRALGQPRLLAIIALSVLGVSGIVCFWLARWVARPVRDLRSSTRRLATGELSARAGDDVTLRVDEFGSLGRDFDDMAGQIETLVQSQRRLLRDVSHELRSPLTRLNIALDLARRKAGADAGPSLDRIERESDCLNELIERLLTLARLERTGTPERAVDVDLAALLEQVVSTCRYEATARECRLNYEKTTSITVIGDPTLLTSAFENVVRNAIRFTANDTAIEITLTRDTPFAVLKVRDHGPGTPEAALPNLFDPFFRDRDSAQNNSGGAGLGLAIVSRAVTAHGGTVTAENCPDGGLVVTVQLPEKATLPDPLPDPAT